MVFYFLGVLSTAYAVVVSINRYKANKRKK
jgi:hypothetical protein